MTSFPVLGGCVTRPEEPITCDYTCFHEEDGECFGFTTEENPVICGQKNIVTLLEEQGSIVCNTQPDYNAKKVYRAEIKAFITYLERRALRRR